MNVKNLVIILMLILAIVTSFLVGGYHTLSPIMFLIGLGGAAVVSGWRAVRMDTKYLVSLIASALIIAVIDEYAHTSVGTLTYFDQGTPSPLTVFGWGIFMILISTMAEFIMKIPSFNVWNKKAVRTLPVLVTVILIPILVGIQGYIRFFNWLLILVYVILGIASFYYSYKHSLAWNLSLMISSLVFGFSMEFIGAIEGLWTFYFMEPVSLFIVFSWPIRTWTVYAFCLFSTREKAISQLLCINLS